MAMFENITGSEKWEFIFGDQKISKIILNRIIFQGSSARFYFYCNVDDLSLKDRWVKNGYNVVEFELFVGGITNFSGGATNYTGEASFVVKGEAPSKNVIFKIDDGLLEFEAVNVFLENVGGSVYD